MLTILSPAKRLDWDGPERPDAAPRLQDQADLLAGHARQLSLGDLKDLMGISDDLARLNRDRFRALKDRDPAQARPAIHAFAGDTFQGLAARDLSDDALRWAAGRLRILSGLYGVLRPMDAIHPYRLEMGSRMKTRRGRDLYAFWGDRIAETLRHDAAAAGTNILLDCASREYASAALRPALGLRVISPRFLDDTGRGPKVVGLFAKRARGAMARFVMEARIEDPDALTAFDLLGYAHAPDLSRPDAPAFLRIS